METTQTAVSVAPRRQCQQRTRESVDAEILRFYAAEGKRPSVTTSAHWTCVHSWLVCNGTTLSKRCDELGLPALRNRSRTWESVDAEIFDFFKRHGRRPQRGDLGGVTAWLEHKGDSLRRRCNFLGLPGDISPNLGCTQEEIDHLILGFVRSNDRRPSVSDLLAVHYWLYRRGSSLRRRCDELGLPPFVSKNARTQHGVDREIREFYQKNRRRPTCCDLPAVQVWLARNGSTINQRCRDLGIAVTRRNKGAASQRRRSYPCNPLA